MNAPDRLGATAPVSWAERNQCWLVKRFADLRDRLDALADGAPPTTPLPSHFLGAEPPPGDGFVPALTRVASLFGLSSFERDTLLLAAGFDLDRSLRQSLTRHTAPGRPAARPSFGLAMALLPDAHWDALSPQAPLRHWRLLSLEPGAPLTDAGLTVDERLLHELTGVAACDEGLHGRARPWPVPPGPASWVTSADAQALLRHTEQALRPQAGRPLLLVMRSAASGSPGGTGDAAAARRMPQAAALLQACGLATLHLRVSDLPTEPADRVDLARAVDREAALRGAALVIELDHGLSGDGGRRLSAWLDELHSPVLVLGHPGRDLMAAQHTHRTMTLEWPADLPAPIDAAPAEIAAAMRRARAQFRLDDVQAEAALATVDMQRLQQTSYSPETVEQAVWTALRRASRGGLDGLARRIDARTTLDDLVLPRAQTAQLRDIVRHLQQRERVLHDWGFAQASSRGLGLCALFAGESGTGKTLAAEAIANAAGLDLYAIDLASVVSKYIGETEKNLARLFDAAEASGAVLLFDEADALFGKRSEVKDSHDRYANIEVAYLLQRIESYRGLAVLTTNLKSALDRAFLRRIRFVVQFPFPDPAARAAIWRRQWPAAAPVDELDLAALARLNLSGGNIRSVALNAAFCAADAGSRITQRVVLEAAHAELAKLERPTPSCAPVAASAVSGNTR